MVVPHNTGELIAAILAVGDSEHATGGLTHGHVSAATGSVGKNEYRFSSISNCHSDSGIIEWLNTQLSYTLV